MNNPFVTIIIPAYNSERTIRKCIESLLGIDYENYEITVVDDGSIDKTKDILSEFRNRIKVIEGRHSGPSQCRNIAVKEAKGEFLAFTDADCIVGKNWLSELIKGFTNDKIAGTGGTQLSPEDETEFGKTVQRFFELTGFLGGYIKNKGDKQIAKVDHNPSCNVMYRKNIFLEIGGFDESLWPSEDVDLDYRFKKKGYEFTYSPKAIVYHYRPQSLKALSKMMFRYGINQAILTKRYGIFRKIQFIPIFLFVLIILIFVNSYWLIVPLMLYFYLLLKVKNFNKANLALFLSIFSLFSWIFGFIKGLLKLKI